MPLSVLGSQAVNLPDLLINTAQSFEALRAAYPEVVSDLVVAVVVSVDGWHASVDVYQAGEGLYLAEDDVGDDLQKGG